MKRFIPILLLVIPLFAFEVQQAPKHERVLPDGQNLHKIISWYGTLDGALDSVVNIFIYKNNKPFGAGSGVILSKDGYIVTNAHVIQNTGNIYVYFNDHSKRLKAEVIGIDKPSDLAVIKIEHKKKLTPIKFADSDALQLTDLVFTIGNSLGLGKTVSQGIISALNKRSLGFFEYENLIQTDATINQGNSGGALVNNQGELIGINTLKVVKTGVSGIGFAIPSNIVKTISKALIEHGKFERGYFGASFAKTKDDKIIIDSIDQKSNAFKAGLREGDAILKVNGNQIYTPRDIIFMIGVKQPGEKITVEFLHNGEIKTKTVPLGRR